jgi:hypothetical protein
MKSLWPASATLHLVEAGHFKLSDVPAPFAIVKFHYLHQVISEDAHFCLPQVTTLSAAIGFVCNILMTNWIICCDF